jgi:hypothetical protein
MRWVSRAYYRHQEHLARHEQLKTWHRWWAWRPVYIRAADYDGIKVPAIWVWLEYVDRMLHDELKCERPVTGGWFFIDIVALFFPSLKWEFRPLTQESKPLCVSPYPRLN